MSVTLRLVGLLAVLAAGPVHAAAASPFVRLVYLRGAATEGCPEASELVGEVDRRLGWQPFTAVSDRLLVVLLERRAPGFVGRLLLHREDGAAAGERRIEAETCRELVRSLAVAGAVLLEAELATPARPQVDPLTPAAPLPDLDQLGAPGPSVRDAGVRPAVTAVGASAPPTSAGAVEVGLGLRLEQEPWAGAGGLGLGPALSVARVRERFGLGLVAHALLPRARSVAGAEVRSHSFGASALACWRPALGQLCGTLGAGLVRGVARAGQGQTGVLRPTASAGIRVARPFGSEGLRLAPFLLAEVALVRWRLLADGQTALRQGPINVGGGLELVALFP